MVDFIYKFIFPYDRIKREYPWFSGEYKPNIFKRIQCIILNEKINPIDWKDITPYNDNSLDKKYNLKKQLLGEYKASECVSQPDMLSVQNQYLRRFIFLIIWIKFYFLVTKYQPLRSFNIVNRLLYSGLLIRVILFSWFYYTLSKIYITRDYQTPFN